jgi:hypothetical protein
MPRLSGPAAVGWDRWVSRSTQDVAEYWNGTVEARKICIGSSSFGAVGLMRVMPGLGDLDRHGFGDAVREGTMVVGRDVRSHRMPDVYDVARIGFIDDFRMFGGVTG